MKRTKNQRFFGAQKSSAFLAWILFLILILLVGCAKVSEEQKVTAGVVLDLGEVDYSNFEVISLQGEGVCAGTESTPCIAVAKFKVKKIVSVNPMQLLEIENDVRQVKGYNKKITFEPGHEYVLKYSVLKLNPTDDVKWRFAGVE